MTMPIARFLTEFELFPAPSGPILLPGCDAEPAPPTLSPEEILAAQLAESREAGRVEARAQAAVTQAEREAALQVTHAAMLEQERQAWVDREGQALALRLTERLDALESRIAAAAATILEPFLPKAIERRALDEVRAAITRLLDNDDAPSIVVTGRADLVRSIERAFGNRAGFRFEPADDQPDVVVRAGETEIRSALAPWSLLLADAHGADT